MTLLKKLIPNTFGLRNIFLYYLLTIFSSSWFIAGNWLFYVYNFISPKNMGVLESLSFTIGLILEVPSGAIADLIGKRKSVVFGFITQTIGLTMFVFAPFSIWFLYVGNILTIAGFAFISGALEALVYDTLVENKLEDKYDYIQGKNETIGFIVFVISSFAGGLMYSYNPVLPWIINAIFFSLASICAILMVEPKIDTEVFTLNSFLKQTKSGLKTLVSIDLRRYILLFVAMSSFYYMWTTGIIRIQSGKEFGFDGETQSYLLGSITFISTIFVYNYNKIKKHISDYFGLNLLTFIAVLGWTLSIVGFGNNFLGFLAFAFLSVSGSLFKMWRSSIVNNNVESKYRATTISTMQFLVQLPYIFVAIIYGYLADINMTKAYYAFAVIILILSLMQFNFYKKTPKLNSKFFL